METEAAPTFGDLLRRYRAAAGLTQEELAERAGLSVRGLGDLERGVKTRPHRETLHLLAQALALEPAESETLQQAARRTNGAPAQDRTRTNLPVQLTSFVGRGQEITTLGTLLEQTRLLTLTGAGGIGKTRLAVQVAAALRDRYRDGVWLVELAPLADPALVPHALAAALDVRGDGRRPLPEVLQEVLRFRHVLLVLDNCEHLLDACAPLVEALLRGASHLHVLVTSREPLGCAGETVWRVPSLTLPAHDTPLSPDVVAHGEAVQLFVARAALARPGFGLREDNAAAVAEVCRRLDGIPLALELAAARLRGLSLADLAVRLDQRFALLTGGLRTALPRQQTLKVAVDWSYALLSPLEQRLFARLRVFAGGFPLEAAEAVGAGGEITPTDVLELLLRLVDKSLVQAEEGTGGETRYRLLETLRQYGRERLADQDEATAIGHRHAAYILALAEQAVLHLQAHDQIAWLARLDAARDDLWLALRWDVDTGAGEEAARLVWALDWFWYLRSPTTSLEWCRQILALPALAPPSRWRARMLAMAGFAHPSEATRRQLLDEALTMSRQVDDPRTEAAVLLSQGIYLLDQGDHAQARSAFEESLALFRTLDNRGYMGVVLCLMAEGACAEGAFERARTLVAEVIALSHSTGDCWREAAARQILGQVACATGDLAEAERLWHSSQATYRVMGDRVGLGSIAAQLGSLAARQGQYETALRHYAVGLKELYERGCGAAAIGWLAELAAVLVAAGKVGAGLRLAAASEALNAAYAVQLPRPIQDERDRAVTLARTELDERKAAALWTEGQAFTLEQAITLAVDESPSS